MLSVNILKSYMIVKRQRDIGILCIWIWSVYMILCIVAIDKRSVTEISIFFCISGYSIERIEVWTWYGSFSIEESFDRPVWFNLFWLAFFQFYFMACNKISKTFFSFISSVWLEVLSYNIDIWHIFWSWFGRVVYSKHIVRGWEGERVIWEAWKYPTKWSFGYSFPPFIWEWISFVWETWWLDRVKMSWNSHGRVWLIARIGRTWFLYVILWNW